MQTFLKTAKPKKQHKPKSQKIAPVANSRKKRTEIEYEPPAPTTAASTVDVKTTTDRLPLAPNVNPRPQIVPTIDYRTAMSVIKQNGLKEGTSLRDTMRALGVTQRPTKIMLWYESTASSGAAAAQAPMFNIRPSLSSEFANLTALYDVYKVHSVKALYHVVITSSTTASTNMDVVAMYDAADNINALASVISAMSAKHHKLVVFNAYPNGSAGIAFPSCVSKDGYFTFNFPVPQEPISLAINSGTSTIVTGTWVPTTVTTVDFGAIKMYVQAPAAGVTTVDMIYGMSVTFKDRE